MKPGDRRYAVLMSWNPVFNEPIVLLSSRVPADARERDFLVDEYFSRWGIEQLFGFLKKTEGSKGLSLEKIFIHSWEGVKRLILFAELAVGFVGLAAVEHPDAVAELVRRWRGKGRTPGFLYYRFIRVLEPLLKGIRPWTE